jgi:hypothetical protein
MLPACGPLRRADRPHPMSERAESIIANRAGELIEASTGDRPHS